MNRRTALTTVAALVGTSTFPGAQVPPYSVGGVATDYRILDLATTREVIVRLPKGNITVETEDIWQALHEYELTKKKKG